MTKRAELLVREAARRLDVFLATEAPGVSRSRAQRLIAEGCVSVNGHLARASTPLRPGDIVQIEQPEPGDTMAKCADGRSDLAIMFEDEQVLVVDKPAGLLVHGSPASQELTLVDLVLQHRPDVAMVGDDSTRAGVVHRLDRDTSGVMVVACTSEALASLQRQFRLREVEKTYMALVCGDVERERAAIEAPLGRDPADRRRRVIVADGKHARSEYAVVERFGAHSLLEVRILTGRTHQIRAHLAAIGHPVVGDRTYGRRERGLAVPRQFLHARRLAFRHPVSGAWLAFESPLPGDLKGVLARLRKDVAA